VLSPVEGIRRLADAEDVAAMVGSRATAGECAATVDSADSVATDAVRRVRSPADPWLDPVPESDFRVIPLNRRRTLCHD
jgi:hypothetical protein